MGARGFTTVEMVLTVAIFGLLAAVSVPVHHSFQTRNDMSITVEATTNALRRAQTYARTGYHDSAWGVKVTGSDTVLFKGASYSGRDTSYDETVELPDSITASGLDEVTFAKLTGKPSTTGTITMVSTIGVTKEIALNAVGRVSY